MGGQGFDRKTNWLAKVRNVSNVGSEFINSRSACYLIGVIRVDRPIFEGLVPFFFAPNVNSNRGDARGIEF
jgi:hypothetical protein